MKKKIIFSIIFVFITNCSDNIKGPKDALDFVKKTISNNPIILEAGAYDGKDTINFKSIWPNSIIYALEPTPNSYQILLENTKNLSNVYCYNLALTSYIGTTKFYIDTHNQGANSINEPVEFNKHEFDKTPIEVNCTTLDNWALNNNIKRIDFMWLDMEGHELYALQSAANILKTVAAIYTEVNYTEVRKGACKYEELKKFLEENNFEEIWKNKWSINFGDALFIKKS